MSLEKEYIRDGQRRVIGTVTTGFDDGHVSVVRDSDGHILGRTSTRYNETRDTSGGFVSRNTADAGLLFRRK